MAFAFAALGIIASEARAGIVVLRNDYTQFCEPGGGGCRIIVNSVVVHDLQYIDRAFPLDDPRLDPGITFYDVAELSTNPNFEIVAPAGWVALKQLEGPEVSGPHPDPWTPDDPQRWNVSFLFNGDSRVYGPSELPGLAIDFAGPVVSSRLQYRGLAFNVAGELVENFGAVPEPANWAMALSGCIVAVLARWRRAR
jgi:hypothetical protein